MSSHKAVIDMIDAELERLAKDRKGADARLMMAKADVDRVTRELQFIDQAINSYQESRNRLTSDRPAHDLV